MATPPTFCSSFAIEGSSSELWDRAEKHLADAESWNARAQAELRSTLERLQRVRAEWQPTSANPAPVQPSQAGALSGKEQFEDSQQKGTSRPIAIAEEREIVGLGSAWTPDVALTSKQASAACLSASKHRSSATAAYCVRSPPQIRASIIGLPSAICFTTLLGTVRRVLTCSSASIGQNPHVRPQPDPSGAYVSRQSLTPC